MTKLTVKQAHQFGVNAQKVGNLEQADVYYTAVLRSAPDHHATNYNMGLLAVDLGKEEDALPFFERATQADPSVEKYWLSYVDNLIKLKKKELAKEIIVKATEKAFSTQFINRLEALLVNSDTNEKRVLQEEELVKLISLYKDGKFEEVIKKASKFTKEVPTEFRIWNILGAAQNSMHQSIDALKAFEKVTILNPHFSEGFNNLGVTFRKLHRSDDAITAFERSLYLKPSFAEAHKNLGNVLKDQENYERAAEAYKNALKFNMRDSDCFHSLALMLQKQGELDEAIDACEKALELKPKSAKIINNLGVMLQQQGRLDKAVDAYTRALSLKPDYADAHNNLGVGLKEFGNLAGAMEAYREAVRFQPDYADAYDNLGRLHWLRRDFVEAFELMEWRWRKKQGSIGVKLKSDKPTWDGNDKKKVFVWKEQGIGDEIMFGSMLSDARRKSRKLIVECDKRLLPLYKRSFPKSIKFVANRKIVNERDYDTQIAIGSLPLAFRRELRDFAGVSSGWLKADYRKVKGIRKKLDAKPNDKIIGITWFTNASDPRAKRRNIPVDIFAKYLAQIPANFVNLQYGETAVHLSKMRSKFDLEVAEIDGIDLFNDLDGLAALISACDIVISIDNATVHLAGALGVDTRVLLPFAPDDRWGIKQADSYWYDSLTLYRQETRGDWQKPLEKLKQYVTSNLS